MLFRILADLTMATHLAFLIFVVGGGLLVARWAWVALLHVPAFVWGGVMSLAGWICPLTPLENRFRQLAGQEGYDTGFIEHYIAGLVYPGGMGRTEQIAVGIGALVLNAAVYGWVVRRRARGRAADIGSGSVT